ncbi:Lipase-like [Actinidia chinensis var. chinensis]|uniref:Lipase-like n=1 Tax=Actinidia chinensis var. chinensis TaxID=1590841 RepID=A0A2R6RJM5_ACTCC|nr:Lipase-like [Actinidia chinensis var. chinensis]
MEGETSSFETSEMVAAFLASTPLLSESWSLCCRATTTQTFAVSRAGDVSYVAFSGVQAVDVLDPGCGNLVAVDGGVFPGLLRHGEAEEKAEEPVMVHSGMLHLFHSMFKYTDFESQMFEIMKESKSVVFTGHSIGGTIASLSTLWFLSYLQSISSPLNVLCITFGSPLLSNESLSKSILQERWGGHFWHVVAKHDIVPSLLLAPLSPLTPQLHALLQYWHLSMTSPQLPVTGQDFYSLAQRAALKQDVAVQLPDEEKNRLFLFVLACVEASAKAGRSGGSSFFWPFGNYVFCTNEGAVCVDDGVAVVKLMHLMLATGNASSSIEDHLKYEDYVGKVSMQFLKRRGFVEGECFESSYEAGVTLALQSSEIASHEPVSGPARDCLRTAIRMGRAPNLNSANLAIALSKITPLRAQIEWYKASCDQSDDQMGYYDTFKLRGASKRDAKVNMNRIKLAQFWDGLIRMLETNQLPHDFLKREKWVNASQFYKLLVEPLDIADYYRLRGMHRDKGHYLTHGRERRYEIFDRWWRNRKVGEEENTTRSRYASLTQDSCFWARVEEAREWIENVRSESDTRKLAMLWENIDKFEQYARKIVERKEVSRDVLAENSSYSLWLKELSELKSQLQQFPPRFPRFFEGEIVP